jgi:hypothetical protein
MQPVLALLASHKHKENNMGQFKPMVKMMTTEPSVILKLKKGGKVEKKADGGYMPMQSTMPAQAPAMASAPMGMAPKRPSMMARRKAMSPKMMNPMMMAKKGGKAEMHDDAAQDRKMIKKAMAGKKFADGGGVTASMAKTTVKGNAGKYLNTDMGTAEHGSKSKGGTGGVKMGNAGGYANGGTIKGNAGKYLNGDIGTAEHGSKAKGGTGGVRMGNGAGFKDGGNVNWENRPADTAKPGVTNTTTGGVKKANGGGYKMGGSTKKAYATGGTVDTGKPVAMPKKPVSRPIANSLQSGTFKDGGEVSKKAKGGTSTWGGSTPLRLLKTHTGPKGHVAKVYKDVDYGEHRVKFFDPKGKHYKDADYHTDDKGDAHDTAKGQLNRYQNGGEAKKYENESRVTPTGDPKVITDKASRELEEALNPLSMAKEGYQKIKDYFTSKPAPAGSVTKTEKSVTVAPKRRGGRA